MTSSVQYTAVLRRHPDSNASAGIAIEAHVDWTLPVTVSLDYHLRGDLRRIRIPPPRPASRAEGLWQHTCFEAFLAGKNLPDYYEFNFSPSAQWAAYYFRGYRDRAPMADPQAAPDIVARSEKSSLHLRANIQLDGLPLISRNGNLRLGLSAVIEDENGTCSYWALHHPEEKPDFHHPEGWALEIQAPK